MAVTDALSILTPNKSWSDIVTGQSSSKTKPLQPAARGTHMCLCTGEFLVMLGYYGWIMAWQDIDHPDADRHGGRIYLHANDLRPGSMPKQGDEVTFFLYVDKNGLGAEDLFATHNPQPPQPPAATSQPAPPKKHGHSKPKISRVTRAKQAETNSCLNAAAQEFVPTVLVPVNAEQKIGTVVNLASTMHLYVNSCRQVPPGLGPVFNAESDEMNPFTPACIGHNMCCTINAKQFYADDDDDSSKDGTESTTSDFSGRVLVAPGLSTYFVSTGTAEKWSTVSSRCAQAVVDLDTDSDSWCDDDPLVLTGAERWAAVSARCAQAVAEVDQQHPWHVRNAAAATKIKANVGDDIRWEVVLDALAELDEGKTSPLPSGLSLPGHVRLPPGLA